MKQILLTVLIAGVLLASCKNQSSGPAHEFYGDAFEDGAALTVADFGDKVIDAGSNVNAIIEGKVVSVCQKKGCWMKLDRGDGSAMHVTFKDYGFFVPLDITGKTVVLSGFGKMDTMNVETLRHYAYDAGKTAEEIESITEPEFELQFEASGVYIKN